VVAEGVGVGGALAGGAGAGAVGVDEEADGFHLLRLRQAVPLEPQYLLLRTPPPPTARARARVTGDVAAWRGGWVPPARAAGARTRTLQRRAQPSGAKLQAG
jgi:hypothetical protein